MALFKNAAALRGFVPLKIREPIGTARKFGSELVRIFHVFVTGPPTMAAVRKYQDDINMLDESINNWEVDLVTGCLRVFLAKGVPVTIDNIEKCNIPPKYYNKR